MNCRQWVVDVYRADALTLNSISCQFSVAGSQQKTPLIAEVFPGN
jgi:hypothetical protein